MSDYFQEIERNFNRLRGKFKMLTGVDFGLMQNWQQREIPLFIILNAMNAVATANLGIGKSGTGENAPLLYQQNRFGELFNYCLKDVEIVKKLLEKVFACGHLKNPRNGKWVRLRRPT